jgi:hypothetical protein
MAEIPWHTLPGEKTEQVLAVLLSREFPNAIRVAPSQGDGGLDVIVQNPDGTWDNYQIKRFTQRLESDQKQQCKRSLRRAVSTNDRADGFKIRHWYLTIPIDPTREEIKWLETARKNAGATFSCEWRPLIFVHSLAAKYPEVREYYFGEGLDRIESLVTSIKSLTSLAEGGSSAGLTPGEVEERLAGVFRELNRSDPHYHYEVAIGGVEPAIAPRPRIIGSVTKKYDETYVTWHVFARYDAAPLDRPVPLELKLDPSAMTQKDLENWQSAVTYGTEARITSGIANVAIDLPGGLGHSGPMGLIKIIPLPNPDMQGGRSRWTIYSDQEGEVLASAIMVVDPFTQGLAGGQHATGTDSSGLIHAEFFIEPQSANVRVGLHIKFDEFQGKPIHAAAEAIRFLTLWSEPNWVAFHDEFDPPPPRAQEAIQGRSPIPMWWDPTLHALDQISVQSRKAMRSPNIVRLTEENSRYLRYIGSLLDGAPLAVKAAEMLALVDREDLDEELEGDARELETRFPLEFEIDDTVYEVESARLVLELARYELAEDQTGAEPNTVKCRIVPIGADGDVKDETIGILTWPATTAQATHVSLSATAAPP